MSEKKKKKVLCLVRPSHNITLGTFTSCSDGREIYKNA